MYTVVRTTAVESLFPLGAQRGVVVDASIDTIQSCDNWLPRCDPSFRMTTYVSPSFARLAILRPTRHDFRLAILAVTSYASPSFASTRHPLPDSP